VLRHHKVPVADYLVIRSKCVGVEDGLERQVGTNLGYPCFVKPSNMGSSVGISKVHNESELRPALVEAAKYDRKILVEEFIDGRELECSVLGNDNPEASVVGEILPCNEFYDYKAKYVDQRSRLIIPADIPAGAVDTIRRLAVRGFLALDCWGMARCDFFMERSTGKILMNELNTIPGFTSISMYPKLWEASGLSYSGLIDRLIELALEKHAERQNILEGLESVSPDRGGGVL
jgi:D-alanine-D-alanine ligase